MAIPNAKKYRLKNPTGAGFATVVAVLPKDADIDAYIKDATGRFDWKAWTEPKRRPPDPKSVSVNRSRRRRPKTAVGRRFRSPLAGGGRNHHLIRSMLGGRSVRLIGSWFPPRQAEAGVPR
jgi:hypothetical protein